MARIIGSVQYKKPKKTGNTPEEYREYKKEYNKKRNLKLMETKKKEWLAEMAAEMAEKAEMDRINFSPYDHIKTLKITIDLFGDEDDIEALERFERDMRRAEMVYADQSGDYSGLKGMVFEEM